jgi:hypothetical protein
MFILCSRNLPPANPTLDGSVQKVPVEILSLNPTKFAKEETVVLYVNTA